MELSEKTGCGWKDRSALYISALLSPFVIFPIFLAVVIHRYSRDMNQFIIVYLISILFSSILPFLNVYVAVKRNRITDVHVADLAQRKGPFIFTLASIMTGTLILIHIKAPVEIITLGYVMFINGFLFFLISLYWKISMHVSGLVGVITALMILVDKSCAVFFLLLPLLIWARLYRSRHNIYQGILGAVVAFAGMTAIFHLFGFPKF